ncbi:hypothetical protein L1049_024070 [Liquidambar formosana]|uniref:Uncharacterized protein n=1 Tax=Liquidambar formosana TaxID=63359 RepID=A0AAP0WY67_LIQFO
MVSLGRKISTSDKSPEFFKVYLPDHSSERMSTINLHSLWVNVQILNPSPPTLANGFVKVVSWL